MGRDREGEELAPDLDPVLGDGGGIFAIQAHGFFIIGAEYGKPVAESLLDPILQADPTRVHLLGLLGTTDFQNAVANPVKGIVTDPRFGGGEKDGFASRGGL